MLTRAGMLAEQIRKQIAGAETVLKAGGMNTEDDRTDAVVGSRVDVLTVRGNVADTALTNVLWARNAGLLPGESITDVTAAVAFLELRETMSASEALQKLRSINGSIADALISLTDEDLGRSAEVVFKGFMTLEELCFEILGHGAYHIGQASGILKSAGLYY